MTTYYTVRYKKAGQIFWRRLRNVEADGDVTGTRWFTDKAGYRYEFARHNHVFKLSPERAKVIEENLARDAAKKGDPK